MAIDQTDVVTRTCVEIVEAVNGFLDSLDKLEKIQEMLAGNAIALTAFEELISTTRGIKHCAPTTYINIVNTFAPYVITQLKALYSGTPTEQGWSGFQKARS